MLVEPPEVLRQKRGCQGGARQVALHRLAHIARDQIGKVGRVRRPHGNEPVIPDQQDQLRADRLTRWRQDRDGEVVELLVDPHVVRYPRRAGQGLAQRGRRFQARQILRLAIQPQQAAFGQGNAAHLVRFEPPVVSVRVVIEKVHAAPAVWSDRNAPPFTRLRCACAVPPPPRCRSGTGRSNRAAR